MESAFVVSAGAVILLLAGPVAAQCPIIMPSDHYVTTDQLELEAESAAGAVGDVVPVTFTLRCRIQDMPQFPWLSLVVCHDPRVAEPVGKPVFGDELAELALSIEPWPVNEDAGTLNQVGHGIIVNINFWNHLIRDRFPSDEPLTIMTMYYRIKGSPGDSGQVSFCDGVLQRGEAHCTVTELITNGQVPYTHFYPGVRTPGTLSVLPGPATHPDRPPEPPDAKVYPTKPTADEVNLRVRISGASARPGDTEVPVEVYVTSDLEYPSVLIPIDFDERYLRLRRAEDHFQTGRVVFDNNDAIEGSDVSEGNAVVFSGLGIAYTRLAAEGEEVHAATLYFDVLEGARDVQETELKVVKVSGAGYSPGYQDTGPWVMVLSDDGPSSSSVPVRTQVSPISIQNGVMLLGPSPLVKRGDANSDGRLDISDPVMLLAKLFLGGAQPACPNAADYNLDRAIDISDPIAILQAIFLGVEPSGVAGAPELVPCR